MTNKAQNKLADVHDDDEDTVGGITQLIEEAMHNHEAVRSEMGSYGVNMPTGTAVTDSLSTALTGTGRRMQMERQVGDIQEACMQLKVCCCMYLISAVFATLLASDFELTLHQAFITW
jgi:hypothetical protein